jgi:NitT/TauT family transport system ATP-binding protein
VSRMTVRSLGKTYPGGTTAIEDISFAIEDGEFVSLMGPSGCGKSTLLRILAGLDTATTGEVDIQRGAYDGALPSAMVFQEHGLFPWMRLHENVAFAFDSLNVPHAEVTARVDKELETVGLGGFPRAFPHELSGGMRQRAAVARAFVADPPVLFMDEPFGALDEQTRAGLGEVLEQLWLKRRKTVVFVTHGIEEALALSDRIIVLGNRPAKIRDIVTVDFPRPRDPIALRRDPRFTDAIAHIWGLLR